MWCWKISSAPIRFDKGCRWRALEPTIAVEEPSWEDHTLLDPPSTEHTEANEIASVKKVIRMNYSKKFSCKKIVSEAFQLSKLLATVIQVQIQILLRKESE